jgi:lipoic acid synthetase
MSLSISEKSNDVSVKKPDWLKVRAPSGEKFAHIKSELRARNLSTVCEEAKCPNISECWNGGTATIMMLGSVCTRGCRFCSVKTGNPRGAFDLNEPQKVLETVRIMGVSYIVITSVDRDDLPDQGSGILAQAIELLRSEEPDLLVEMLIPDFRGDERWVNKIVDSGLHVLAHNIETTRSLTKRVRDGRAGYDQSLRVLEMSKKRRPTIVTKSSIMLGLGEERGELLQTMDDLLDVGVEVLTLGQYLQPTPRHLPVKRFVEPQEFLELEIIAKQKGFAYVASGPLVRSSYRAGELYLENKIRNNPGMHGVL